MRLLITSVPGLGHLHPVLPLALAAAAAGHDVRVATGADRTDWVSRCGAVAVPAGLSHDALVQEASLQGLTGPERPRRMFTTIAVPPMTTDLLEMARGWRPDLVVHEEGEYAAPLVAALLGVSCVTHSWPSPARQEAGRALLDEPLADIWRRFGAEGPVRQTGDLYLDACPPLLQHPDALDAVPKVVAVHPSGFDGPAQTVPAWLEALPRPAVYVTLGTEPAFSKPELLQRLVDGASAVAAGLVVSTGPHPPDVIQRPHDGVHAVQYLPQSLVLPRVDAVVGHGGAGTTVGALLHGLPVLVLPGLAPSQRASAERVAASGVGLHLDWQQATPDRLQGAVDGLLTDWHLTETARAARAQIDLLPTPAEVVRLLADG